MDRFEVASGGKVAIDAGPDTVEVRVSSGDGTTSASMSVADAVRFAHALAAAAAMATEHELLRMVAMR